METLLKIFILFLMGISVNGVCLSNLRVKEATNRTITLDWDYSCYAQASSVSFKVYYEHQKFMACRTGKKDKSTGPGRGNVLVEDIDEITIRNLHPFSVYKLTVKALPEYKNSRNSKIPEEQEYIGETLEGVPNVRPITSSIQSRVQPKSIRFYWNQPEQSKCEHFNAQLDGFYYIFKGIETWNVNTKIQASTTSNSETFNDLRPFSNYMLFVYARTREGKHNPDLPFKIPAETTAEERASRPRDLKVSQINQDFHLTWLPPYPPTGIVSYYKIRWKPIDSEVWSNHERVEPNSDLCSDDQENYTRNEYEKRICTTLQLELANATFQVVAYNAGSSIAGHWTSEVYPMPETDSESFGVFFIIIIVVIVALVLLIVIVIFVCRTTSNRYKNVPDYAANNASIQPQRPYSLPPPWTPDSTRRSFRQNSQTTSATSISKYQHLLLPEMNHRRASGDKQSIQETPLPPLPGKDPIYEELSQDTLLRNKSTKSTPEEFVRVSFNAVNENQSDDDEEFLKPSISVQDEDGYLRPKDKNSHSDDEAEYLAPTFNQFRRINSRDLSPPHEEPPPIPLQSYVAVPQKSNEAGPSATLHQGYVPMEDVVQRKRSS